MNVITDYKAITEGPPRVRPKPEPCTITSDQAEAWTETRTVLLLACPAFSHILYTMMNPHHREDVVLWTKDVPIAAVDGVTLFLNPDRFFKYTLIERVFIVAHEILHCMFNHCGIMHGFATRGKIGYLDGTFLKYIGDLFNRAADLVINAMLIDSKVGAYNKDWLYDTNFAKAEDSVIEVYRRLFDEMTKRHGKGWEDKEPTITVVKGEGFDEHLQPGAEDGQDPTEAEQGRNETEWRTAIAAAAAAAQAQGKLPEVLKRLFGAILEPVVDWREQIQTFFARKTGQGGYDWRRPERRLIVRGLTSVLEGDSIFAPGRSGFGAGTIVVAGDTSGSIDYRPGSIGDKFLTEMAGILEAIRPKRMVIMWCDAAVGRVDEVEDACDIDHIRFLGAPGGGGTSFVPVFEEIKKMGLELDALVYLTDGDGTFPAGAPSYPVLWGDISSNKSKYPFGEVVDLKDLKH